MKAENRYHAQNIISEFNNGDEVMYIVNDKYITVDSSDSNSLYALIECHTVITIRYIDNNIDRPYFKIISIHKDSEVILEENFTGIISIGLFIMLSNHSITRIRTNPYI